jgi:hypothetical protein
MAFSSKLQRFREVVENVSGLAYFYNASTEGVREPVEVTAGFPDEQLHGLLDEGRPAHAEAVGGEQSALQSVQAGARLVVYEQRGLEHEVSFLPHGRGCGCLVPPYSA